MTERAQYFFVFLNILINAGSLKIITDEFLLGIFIFSFFLFIMEKQQFDIAVIYLIAAWVAINIASYGFNQTSFNTWTFIGFIIKILYPYFLLKLIGETFFDKLEKIIFVLTCISLPLFAIQVLYPGVLEVFTPLLSNITADEISASGGWYGIIFRINESVPFRNSGFMWEPGAFAFMLLLVLSFRITKYGLKLDRRNIIYIIALATTFSTMGYLGIALLLIAYTISSKKIGIIFLMIPLAIFYMNFVADLDFMLPKIQDYLLTMDKSWVPKGRAYIKVNRLAYIIFSFRQAVYWPLGFGIIPSKYMYNEYTSKMLEGVGTIAKLLLFWGWLGLTFFISAFYKFYKCLQNKTDHILVILAVIILIVAFFSNPLEKSPILYTIVFYPFIFKNVC